MKILVVGGTRFFGIPMVNALLFNNHEVTIATRGLTKDPFGNRVKRILFDRRNPDSVKEAFKDTHFDVVIDKIAYSSNDVKRLLDVVSCDRYILMSSTAVYDPLMDMILSCNGLNVRMHRTVLVSNRQRRHFVRPMNKSNGLRFVIRLFLVWMITQSGWNFM